MHGWRGTVLRIDLTKKKITKQPLNRSEAHDFLGGRGLNSLTLFKEIKPGIDPLSPNNILCLAPGVLSGTALGLTGRVEVSTLSPLSNILGDGSAGGNFAVFLKRAGYDQIVITGRATKPTYIWIDDDQVVLKEAKHLWGKDTWQTADLLHKALGKNISVACIGQAGENLVRMATTMVDKHSSAAVGSGAVWGSKNLKAIAVHGTGRIDPFDREKFLKLCKEDWRFFSTDPFQRDVVAVYGTHIGMAGWGAHRRYFQKTLYGEDVPKKLQPEAWKKYEIGRDGCHSCSVKCKNVYEVCTAKDKKEVGKGLEFEGIDCLGTNCGINDPEAIMCMANQADRYGMCVIGLGNAIAFAKELFNKKILSKTDTQGLDLKWPDAETQIKLIHDTALRKGFGNIVAEGMYNMAKIIGKGAMEYCYHVKGFSKGVHPDGLFALAHATSTRGADHLRGRSWADFKGNAKQFKRAVANRDIPNMPFEIAGRLTVAEWAVTVTDAIGRCKGAVNNWDCAMPLVSKYPLWVGLAMILTAVTGEKFTAKQIANIGERIYLLEMAFNVRQGISRKHDRLPQTPNVKRSKEGLAQQKRHAALLTRYYKLHGCDPKTGIPTRKRLEKLGLGFVADELEKGMPYRDWEELMGEELTSSRTHELTKKMGA